MVFGVRILPTYVLFVRVLRRACDHSGRPRSKGNAATIELFVMPASLIRIAGEYDICISTYIVGLNVDNAVLSLGSTAVSLHTLLSLPLTRKVACFRLRPLETGYIYSLVACNTGLSRGS